MKIIPEKQQTCDNCGALEAPHGPYQGRDSCPTDRDDEIREYDYYLCDNCEQERQERKRFDRALMVHNEYRGGCFETE